MNCRIYLRFIRSVVLMVLGFLVYSCNKLTEEIPEVNYNNPIKIGVIAPISEIRSLAESRNLTIMLAIEEINRSGGIYGRDLMPVFKDDAGDPETAVDAVVELNSQDINLLLAPVWSRVALAVCEQVCIPNNMLFIGSVTTSPEVSELEDRNLVWRTTPSDRVQGRIGAEYVSQHLNKKTVGIIFLDDPYAIDLATIFKENFENENGFGSVLSFIKYPSVEDWNTFDFSNYLDQLFFDKPELIYFVSFSQDASQITHSIVENEYFDENYRPLLFSTDGPFTSDFLLNGHPEILEGMQGTQSSPDPNSLNNMLFKQNFYKRFGIEHVQFSQETYDAVYLLAYAMLNANSTEAVTIADKLRSVSGSPHQADAVIINVNEFSKAKSVIESGGCIDYKGASGNIEFDSLGDPSSGSYVIYHIINGKYTIDSTIYF
ncbi:MAG: ABC transporter substrate-binding protein [Bacteroidales bacterium]|nr:ABC transporter substrate-binding protein [Bacteroidales bacterium]